MDVLSVFTRNLSIFYVDPAQFGTAFAKCRACKRQGLTAVNQTKKVALGVRLRWRCNVPEMTSRRPEKHGHE